ncbi:MAG: RNA methyltransferase [Planctomycetes bacterium]|nr:RNA methyltransferase [Planctomycetota bacterium]
MATQRELRRLRSLKTGKGRRESNQYAAEGVRLLEESRRHGIDPVALYFDPGALSDRGRRLLDDLRTHGIRCEEIAKKRLESAADTKTPQGLIGVFNYPEIPLDSLKTCRRLLICDGISDPGNVGTLIRSAQAFDFDAVLLTGESADPFSPKVVRSTAGAIFGIPALKTSIEDCLCFLDNSEFALVAGAPSATRGTGLLADFSGDRQLALAIGSEGEGVSPGLLERSALRLAIRHSDRVESLNAGVAGSLLMRELYDLPGDVR